MNKYIFGRTLQGALNLGPAFPHHPVTICLNKTVSVTPIYLQNYLESFWFGLFLFNLNYMNISKPNNFYNRSNIGESDMNITRVEMELSVFFHSVYSNVSLNCLHQQMDSHIGCICSTYLHCASFNVPSNCLPGKRQSRTGCICWIFSTVFF